MKTLQFFHPKLRRFDVIEIQFCRRNDLSIDLHHLVALVSDSSSPFSFVDFDSLLTYFLSVEFRHNFESASILALITSDERSFLQQVITSDIN